MQQVKVTPEATEAIKHFKMPSDYGFGRVLSPIMIRCDYSDGKWGDVELLPYQNISLAPTAKVLHYGQEIFEGMKGYFIGGNGPFLFRPEENAKRFNVSATRMAMPEVPTDIYVETAKAITNYSKEFIPRRSGESLYIRHFMYATEESLGIKPSEKFTFLVVASPSGAYFKEGSLTVLIEREDIRAAPGGIGFAKTGGNYAASLNSAIKVKKKGLMQTLWLDAIERKYVEELSGMNFFAVYDQTLVTPPTSDTILDGITRKSIIEMAKYLGLKVSVEPIEVNQLMKDIEDKKCQECFSCGTAAIITPIQSFHEENGNSYLLKESFGPIAKKLKETLLSIQEGSGEDPFNWRVETE